MRRIKEEIGPLLAAFPFAAALALAACSGSGFGGDNGTAARDQAGVAGTAALLSSDNQDETVGTTVQDAQGVTIPGVEVAW